jgi:hypothetical protein
VFLPFTNPGTVRANQPQRKTTQLSQIPAAWIC